MSQQGFVELLNELRAERKCELTDIPLGYGGECKLGVFTGVYPEGDKCAVKRLHADDAITAKGPIEEYRRMREMKHVNLVTYYGIDPIHNDLGQLTELWLTMELCQKETLHHWGRRGLSDSRVVQIAQQVLSGLEHLHHNQIVHRDLKGTNVLFGFDNTIKLADFGTSRKLKDIITRTGEIELDAQGTWPYMPPEAVNDTTGRIGRSFDMWSFGCLLIEMVTGRLPLYRNFSTDEVITFSTSGLFHIGKGNGPRFSKNSFPRTYSEAHKIVLMTVIEACVTERPGDRPTATELRQYIGDAFGKEAVAAEMAALMGSFTLEEKELIPKSSASKSGCFSDSGASALQTVRLKSFLSEDSRMKTIQFKEKEPKPATFRQSVFKFKKYVMMDIFSGLEIQKFIVRYLDELRTSRPPDGLPCGLLLESPDANIERYKTCSGYDVEIGTITTFNRGRQYDTLIMWPNESNNSKDKLTTKKQLEEVFSIKANQLIIIGSFRTGIEARESADLSSRCNWKLLIEDATEGKRLLRVSPTALTSDVAP